MPISQFQMFKINHINRSENKHADALSKLAATSFIHLAKEIRITLRIISDNGTNFASEDLQKWFKEMKIEHNFASVAHPQANGQVESVKKQIVDGIKARLGTAHRGWVDELPIILWAHRTMPKTSIGETPFSLVYGSEAVIPTEIGLPSPRVLAMEKQSNE
ncbi:uncharacterized protein LOC110876879 [Helianthus annuus]|uniref:uncharacterized protein LOC110876879 n=1 Tax=Helianthus annuus TaxID=4232 RepID=UPI000B8F0EFF|nr:uncharacterized protein LOC110876879 [Helianthus annuus]